MSTMNGYIEQFTPKDIHRTNIGYAVEADVTISASRIENFIGLSVGSVGGIEGNTLLAEQNRRLAQIRADQLQARARGEIFDRIFHGFPSQVADINVSHIGLSETDANLLTLDLEFSYKPGFIRVVERTLETLALHECIRTKRDIYSNLYNLARTASYESLCLGTAPVGLLGSMPTQGDIPRDAICLGFSDIIKCYQLPPGTYCASCDLADFSFPPVMAGMRQGGLLVFGRFVDAIGQSANVGDPCITPSFNSGVNSFFESGSSDPAKRRLIAAIDFVTQRLTLSVKTSSVNLEKVKYFVAVPALQDGNETSWVTNLVPEMGEKAKGGCELLDEAVQTQLLTKSANSPVPKSMPSSSSAAALTETAPKALAAPLPLGPQGTVGNKDVVGLPPVSPSFDCTTARSGAARLICSDMELSKADADLGKTLQTSLARLEGTDKSAAIKDQVGWIHARNTRCGLNNKEDASLETLAAAKGCMLQAMQSRIQYFGSANVAALPATVTTEAPPAQALAVTPKALEGGSVSPKKKDYPTTLLLQQPPADQGNPKTEAFQYIISLMPNSGWRKDGLMVAGDEHDILVPYDGLEVTVNHYFPFGAGPEQLFVGTTGIFGGTGVRIYSGSYDQNKTEWDKVIIALRKLGVHAATPSGPDRDIRSIQ
jgi:uncharacterized protein YecT (DUF1311 family)